MAQFLGVTSGWAGVTITKFFSDILLDYQTRIALSLEQFWDRSVVVSEHVVTYIRAWSVTPTSSLYLLEGNSVPGPSVCRDFVSLLSLLLQSCSTPPLISSR